MNQARFQKWMSAVDDDLLEEARRPLKKKKRTWLYSTVGLAACAAVIIGIYAGTSKKPDEPQVVQTMIANPMHETGEAELTQLGYSIPLPDGASDASYYLIDTGEDGKQMAEVSFERDGQEYYCRALKSEQPQDISGIYSEWTETEEWSGDGISVQLRESDDAAWVGWHASEAEIQWCVVGGSDTGVLLNTAGEIVEKLGYVMPLYPMESAQDALKDGQYAAAFDASSFTATKQGYSLKAEVYDFDWYAPDDIQALRPGDVIEFNREPVTVETMEWNNGLLIINGGIDKGGIELIENCGLFRPVTVNDHPVYYDLGEVTIPLSPDCMLEDHEDLEKEPDGVVYALEDIPGVAETSLMPFYCYNTVIVVRDEQIVKIIRNWIP